MLETVRAFGLERLIESGEEPTALAAHAVHVLSLAGQVRERLFAPGFDRVLAALDAEHDNVRAALTWAETAGEAEIGLRLAAAMGSYWVFRGHFREGRRWLERALVRADRTPSATRAFALVRVGWLTSLQGELDVAEPFLLDGLGIARTTGDRWNEALALLGLGMMALQRGETARAAAWTRAALPVFREIEGVEVAGPHFFSVANASLAQILLIQGHTAAAEAHLAEALRRQRALDFPWGLGDTLRILGDLAATRGDTEAALTNYRESLELARLHGDHRLLADSFDGIAGALTARRQPERAARLYGAAAALRARIGSPAGGWDRATYDRGVAATRVALTKEAFATAWADGEAMSSDASFAEVQTGAEHVAEPERLAAATDPGSGAGLTARELDVIRLLARGLTDREIAEAIFISPRTVNFHVTNLLGKLGVESRTAAAAYAIRHGLA
jgi:non-specific serine/threonine protein kinase